MSLVRTEHSDDREKADYVRSPTDPYMKLIATLRPLRVTTKCRVDSKTKEETLNILGESVAAACVVNVGVMSNAM
jgi:hypothetical protein